MLLKKQSTIGPKVTWVKEAELVVAEERMGSSEAVAVFVCSTLALLILYLPQAEHL